MKKFRKEIDYALIDTFLRKCGSNLVGKSIEEIVISFVSYLEEITVEDINGEA